MLGRAKGEIEGAGSAIAVVHMQRDPAAFDAMAKASGLDGVAAVADPEVELYRHASLPRGRVGQVMGPRIWWRGFVNVLLKRNLPGRPEGDVMQLSGVLLLHQGRIVRRWQPTSSADQPDYATLAKPPTLGDRQ